MRSSQPKRGLAQIRDRDTLPVTAGILDKEARRRNTVIYYLTLGVNSQV